MKHRPSLVACLSLCAAAASAAEPRPNIVFILADDLGAHDVGCFGSTFHETPNIDRLAARGVKLTQAYAASPLCSPTRSSVLTGQYPARTGITSPACHMPQVQLEKRLSPGKNPAFKVLNADSLTRLKPDYFTLAEALKEAGYATAHFGKWHLGHNLPANPNDRYEPKDQGFDFDFPHTPSAAGPGGGYLAPWAKFIKDPAIVGQPGEHIEDRMSAEAAKYISEHKDRPFYVNYWAYSVHSPWNARRDYIDYFTPKADPKNPQHNPLYAAMVRSLDDGVGRILKAIDDAGVADRTIIVFFSDNGGPVSSGANNGALRGGKGQLFEGGVRVPFLVSWPDKLPAGKTYDQPVISLDAFASALAAAGVPMPTDKPYDSVNIVPHLAGNIKSPPHERLFWRLRAKEFAVREGAWKLIEPDGKPAQLFDLASDSGETKDLAADKLDIALSLAASLAEWRKELKPPAFPGSSVKSEDWGPGGANQKNAAPKKNAPPAPPPN